MPALVEKLKFLIENPKARLVMGQEGRRVVEKRFNIQQLNKDLIKIYALTLSKPEPSRDGR